MYSLSPYLRYLGFYVVPVRTTSFPFSVIRTSTLSLLSTGPCITLSVQVAETVFDTINHEYDKAEQKKKQKNRAKFGNEEKESDCILHGYVKKLVGHDSTGDPSPRPTPC